MINEAPWQKKKRNKPHQERMQQWREREGKLCTAPGKPLPWIHSPWGAAKRDNTVGSQIQEWSPPHRGAPHLPWMPSSWGGAAEVKEARRSCRCRRQRLVRRRQLGATARQHLLDSALARQILCIKGQSIKYNTNIFANAYKRQA